jgi:hypothetical protein
MGPRTWRAALLLAALCWPGCGDNQHADDPSAPAISDLVLTTTTVPVAQGTTVTGTVSYRDADGDPGELIGELLLPDSTSNPVTGRLLDAAAGQVEGTVHFEVAVKAGTAGRHTLKLRMLDVLFHPSNTLEASFEAQ